jgi:formamidopyrimidine-DNA glycosylase
MPELPEVETVRRTLAPAVGAVVTDIWTSGLALHQGRVPDEVALARACAGAALERVRRLGKYLLLDFEDRDELVIVHLGMSGRFRIHLEREPVDAHVHVRLAMRDAGNAALELRFRDPRRFGLVTTAWRGREREHPALARLGVDPLSLDAAALAAVLLEKTRGRSLPLKAALLDQRIVAGIGNIYASEALWEARIHPDTPAGRLTRTRANELARAILEVLHRALDHGGTSLRDFVAADGASGEHAHYLWVYGREGLPCPRELCGTSISRRVHQGRATFFCRRCQRAPRGASP